MLTHKKMLFHLLLVLFKLQITLRRFIAAPAHNDQQRVTGSEIGFWTWLSQLHQARLWENFFRGLWASKWILVAANMTSGFGCYFLLVIFTCIPRCLLVILWLCKKGCCNKDCTLINVKSCNIVFKMLIIRNVLWMNFVVQSIVQWNRYSENLIAIREARNINSEMWQTFFIPFTREVE